MPEYQSCTCLNTTLLPQNLLTICSKQQLESVVGKCRPRKTKHNPAIDPLILRYQFITVHDSYKKDKFIHSGITPCPSKVKVAIANSKSCLTLAQITELLHFHLKKRSHILQSDSYTVQTVHPVIKTQYCML